MSTLEGLAWKRLRSFALFSSKKRQKYEAAYALFGQAARQYLVEKKVDKAAECCKQQARLCINKLRLPVESAMHYMEATRAWMLAEDYDAAFQCLQLAVQARTRPNVKHKDETDQTPGLAVPGITVLDAVESSQSAKILSSASQRTTPQSGELMATRRSAASVGGLPEFPPLSQSAIFPSSATSTFSSSSQHHSPTSLSASNSNSNSVNLGSKPLPTHAALFLAAQNGNGNLSLTRSPALTAQAGTISVEGRSLYLSPETMTAPISSAPASSRSISIQPHPSSGGAGASSLSSIFLPPSSLASSSPAKPAAASSLSASSGASTAVSSPADDPRTLPARQRRHSLSGSANGSNVTVDGVVHSDVLHLDLLLARLAVQLAADLWTDLDFRDAVLALEIASSLFATLLIAERQYGTFRVGRPPAVSAPVRPSAAALAANSATLGASSSSPFVFPATTDPPLLRAESATSPNTPTAVHPAPTPTTSDATLAIQERLAGLLGPAAFSTAASSQTLGSFTLSSRPIVTKPLPSLLMARDDPTPSDDVDLVLHAPDPYASVGEGEFYLENMNDPGTSILEESLVCRFQLALYYVSFDEELHASDIALLASPTAASPSAGSNQTAAQLAQQSLVEHHRNTYATNQELRRAKALFEQVASQKPDEWLLHANILPALNESMVASLVPPITTPRLIDEAATLIAQYAADDDKLHSCLFLAGLCDALIGIRIFCAAKAAQKAMVAPSSSKSTPNSVAASAAALAAAAAKKKHPPATPSAAPSPAGAAAAAGSTSSSTSNASSASPGSSSRSLLPPPLPDLYLQSRTVFCPPILLRYRDMCASFGCTAEIRLLRACNGLLQMAANLGARLSDTFGSSPHVAKQLFQAAWGAEIIREFTEVVSVFTKQRPLANTQAKLLLAIKKGMKAAIAL